jgi:thiol-disulfide isomerase/thioredoxin
MARYQKPATSVLLALMLGFSALSGCESSKSDNTSPSLETSQVSSQESKSGEVTGSVSSPTSQVKLIDGDQDTLAAILEGHKGKVILVDFWATWCGPCVKQFPHSMELSHKYRQDGFAVVSVSMNEPDEKESVLAFLVRQNADIDNLLPKYGAGTEFLEAFDLRGDVPFYRLYDRRGKLRYAFSGDPDGIANCESVELIDQRVAELVQEDR